MKEISLPGKISRLQTLLLLLFLILGLINAFEIPYGAGFDEEQHLRRMWEMSALVLKPNSKLGPEMPIPASFSRLSYRNLNIIRPVPQPLKSQISEVRLGDLGWIYDDTETRSVYSPLLLGPQTLAVRYLGRKYQVPFFWILFSGRAIGLSIYVALIYLAIRIIPFGKWPFAILALTPTALFQAATLSADTLSNGFAFLFLAGSLAIAQKKNLGWRSWGILVGLFVLLFATKINLVVLGLLPFLILRPQDFRKKSAYYSLVLVAAIIFIFEVVFWNYFSYVPTQTSASQSQPVLQLIFLAQNPWFYLSGLVSDLQINGLNYLRGLIGAYGYYYWTEPPLTYVFFAAALIVSILQKEENSPKIRVRISFLTILVLSYLATAISLQLTAEPVGSQNIHELHGRYFTPLIPLLVLALVTKKSNPLMQNSILSKLIFTAGGISLVLFVGGLTLSYHVSCGSSILGLSTCYQPQYKNWAPDQNFSGPLDELGEVRQSLVTECNGLESVRIWASSSSQREPGLIEVKLIEGQDGSEIAVMKTENSSVPIPGWIVLEFPRMDNSLENQFELILNATGVENGDGIRLGLTDRPEYERGQLTFDGRQNSRDLFFQYGCETGFLKSQ